MKSEFSLVVSIALALLTMALVARLLSERSESVTELERPAAFESVEDADPKAGDGVGAPVPEPDIQSHEREPAVEEIQNGSPGGVLTFSRWSEMQAYADQSFSRWSTDRPKPDDTGFGYFDGVIGGGFDPAVRFRINSVSLSTQYLEEDDTCRLRIDARPLSGQDADSFGVLNIDLTMHGLECQTPADLVGQRLDFREGDRYAVELTSYYRLGKGGKTNWGTRWINSGEIHKPFILHVLAQDDGYLIGAMQGLLIVRTYQGEDMLYQRRQGTLIGHFRARI